MKDIFRNLETIETDRLILRPVMAGDVDAVFRLMSDPDISRFTTWRQHRNIEDSKQFVNFMLSRYVQNKPSNWAIIEKKSGTFTGTCGFVSSFMANSRAEIGFAVTREFRGRGYATEAVKRSIVFGFEKIGLNRIEACCDAENTASSRVLEKAGMKFEGVLRQYAFINGSFRDMRNYSILRSEM
ncbi:MAG TPA: GNAT family N-acetyltransferase [Candidatus Goldiibacteriota bacterium]|nr:GNAT family N-acetyltransferase [Candidatus Goldiibacteriota bacterium]